MRPSRQDTQPRLKGLETLLGDITYDLSLEKIRSCNLDACKSEMTIMGTFLDTLWVHMKQDYEACKKTCENSLLL